jgi:hypothetical protein
MKRALVLFAVLLATPIDAACIRWGAGAERQGGMQGQIGRR